MAAKVREMVLNRNHTLTSIYGHSVRFEKDVPTHVPPVMHPEAVAIGAVYVDGKGVQVDEDKRVPEPTDPAARDAAILAAVIAIADKNDAHDFSGSGVPKTDAVSALAGFKVSGKDVAKAWQVRADRIAEEKFG